MSGIPYQGFFHLGGDNRLVAMNWGGEGRRRGNWRPPGFPLVPPRVLTFRISRTLSPRLIGDTDSRGMRLARTSSAQHLAVFSRDSGSRNRGEHVFADSTSWILGLTRLRGCSLSAKCRTHRVKRHTRLNVRGTALCGRILYVVYIILISCLESCRTVSRQISHFYDLPGER